MGVQGPSKMAYTGRHGFVGLEDGLCARHDLVELALFREFSDCVATLCIVADVEEGWSLQQLFAAASESSKHKYEFGLVSC
jgi:hypothetical protein